SILNDEPEFNPPADDRSQQFKFAYTCDLPNPYVRNMTITFPETDATGSFMLTIFSSDGRIVHEKKYGEVELGYVDAPLQPGIYWVTLRKGSTPLCTQKLIVN
ncbi:MAG: T9SS type A sorting domain-containing protein, partial [Saprospiraceae bacterium]|nr:T9SS type A sorting domain-containing protein [Saprospiraceae bacterium]